MSKEETADQISYRFMKLPHAEQKNKIQWAYLTSRITHAEFYLLMIEYIAQVEVEDE